ncbi:hypothetical protein [Nocardia nova]|uniref:hypothetical protein n=1 Tax=Nocardia nova TaxID=37330 RepID=UPI0027392777|nr:hypothetical protein [Nocardia nova]
MRAQFTATSSTTPAAGALSASVELTRTHAGAETADCEETRLTRTAFGVSGSAADTSTVR